MSLVKILKRLWNWYFCKDLPELENILPSGHGEWTRYPTATKDTQVDMPVVAEVKAQTVTIVSARERSKLHAVQLIPDTPWLNSTPNTDPLKLADINTIPVERDTEATIETAIIKLLHVSRGGK